MLCNSNPPRRTGDDRPNEERMALASPTGLGCCVCRGMHAGSTYGYSISYCHTDTRTYGYSMSYYHTDTRTYSNSYRNPCPNPHSNPNTNSLAHF